VTTAAGPSVVIVGAGPCGVILANLLGSFGVETMIIDREIDVLDYPRAVGIDDESLRTLGSLGLADEATRDMIPNTPIRYYSSDGHCFAHVKPTERPFGWPRRNNFLQPLFERTLRDGLSRFSTVEVRYGWELRGFSQNEEGVTAEILDRSGTQHTIGTRFLVGADGGRSRVRWLAGIQLRGSTASSKWLVVDVRNDTMVAPYAAVHCHPESPTMVIALPYRHRRFEFKLRATDLEADVVKEDQIAKRLAPFYPKGPLPEIVRGRVYMHHSRVAESFQSGRVFLAGDAAHLQPPFFGQGMNSGIRDATNLAWKLAAVLDGIVDESVLASYDFERRAHATAMVSFATRIGRLYSPRNRFTEMTRDGLFQVINRLPGARDYILQMKYKPMPNYIGGLVISPSLKGSIVGRMAPQPSVETMDGVRQRLDVALGSWFCVVGIHCDPLAQLKDEGRSIWERLNARMVTIRIPRDGPVPGTEPGATPEPKSFAAGAATPLETVPVVDVDGVFVEMALTRPSEQILVIRPDRYVMAACRTEEFEQVTGQIGRMLGGNSGVIRPRRAIPGGQ
jgi:3-(3-hydroxy-phenyl)propionate hydroxylase